MISLSPFCTPPPSPEGYSSASFQVQNRYRMSLPLCRRNKLKLPQDELPDHGLTVLQNTSPHSCSPSSTLTARQAGPQETGASTTEKSKESTPHAFSRLYRLTQIPSQKCQAHVKQKHRDVSVQGSGGPPTSNTITRAFLCYQAGCYVSLC